MFGENLSKLRKQKKISQYVLAEQLGMSRGQIGNYELGKRQPDYNTLIKIAEYFNVTVDELIKDSKKLKAAGHLPLKPAGRAKNVPLGTGVENTVFPIGKEREIDIYNLIPKNRDEIFAPENIIGSQLVLADSVYNKGFKAIDNSMSGSQIVTGTNVLIEEDDNAVDGEIVVAQVPGYDELLIRRYTAANDEITLIPDNSNYKPQIFRVKDVRIIGVVTELRTNIGRKSK